MRIAVISDIHGNYEAFERVLEDIQKQTVDRVISLGDNIGYGADSEKVIGLVRSENITSILGNHEMAVIDARVKAWFKRDAGKAIDIAIASLSRESIAFIETLDRSLSEAGCYFVHGFPPDSVRFYLHQLGDDKIRTTLDGMSESVCFVGHTHQLNLVYPEGEGLRWIKPEQGIRRLNSNRSCFVNAGSVGQPRDGSSRAQYLIWDTDTRELSIRLVSYDVATAVKKIAQAGIPLRYARILEGDLRV